MKNLAKDYAYGFAHGFGETSLKYFYFAYSSLKEKNDLKAKTSELHQIGIYHGANLGLISIGIQLSVYSIIASKGHLEILAILGGTNILSYIYENYKYLWKED